MSNQGRWIVHVVWVWFIAVAFGAAQEAGTRGCVASVQPLATQAGIEVFRKGGNAIDAAVATALTLGVVDGHNSGLGGGCFVLIRKADGSLHAIDGREAAPALAHRDMFLRNGKAMPQWSQTGPLAAGTPGALAAYDTALRLHGRRTLGELILPAAEIAEAGFAIDRVYARNLKATAEKIARFPAAASLLLKPDGSPYQAGETLRLPDLARTYRQIAQHGADWFYRGEFARRVSEWMVDNGGLLRADDFAAYQAKVREPLQTTYRRHRIVGFPPPSSGGVHVAQILNIVESFDLAALHSQDPAVFTHVVAEAMRLAFADRAHWLGDADFVLVPKGLIDRDYARQLAARIQLDRAQADVRHGEPPDADSQVFGKHTTHIAAADGDGNWVAITATVNTSFGCKVVVPGTGVVLNNQMDDFAVQPGVPNSFGLLGAEANAVAPGKRPLSSMSPTIVLRDGQPVLTLGAAGGPTIINQVVLAIINHLDLRLPVSDAVAAPRFHHQWSPDRLLVEDRFDPALDAKWTALGHRVERTRQIGVTQAIGWDAASQSFIGVHDPRVPGQAAATP